MDPIQEKTIQSRRSFLTTAAGGVGGMALASMLCDDGVLATLQPEAVNPLAPKPPHFEAKAKACIFIFMAGAPSQLELFDPKPKLAELHGQKLPDSLIDKVRFAFIQKEKAVLMGGYRKFKRHGQCGMELSDLIPYIGEHADDICLVRSMHSEAFNHHPGQLMMNTGVPMFGRPSIGSWLNYGLGSVSQDLPGYVVLTSGRGTSGGTSNWTSGFLPSTYEGVPFRNQGEPILHLSNPADMPHDCQRRGLEATRDLNQMHHEATLDPEILSRIASYELAYRMQSAAPDLIDLSDESEATLEMYGVNREEGEWKRHRNGGGDEFKSFASNCLLARRMVERGVRYINIYHATWDHHSDMDKRIQFNSLMADQPIGALLGDLKDRGLLNSTLVVWGSEFGRTPLGEKPHRQRSQHWPRPPPLRLLDVGGGRRHPRRASHRQDRWTSAGISKKTRSTSTISTPRCCIFSVSITSNSRTATKAATSALPTSPARL